jgi:hypothetical protein
MKNIIDDSNSFTHVDGARSLDGLSAMELLRPLAEVSNNELWRGVRSITLQTQELTAKLVAFLAEVERRRLWADMACGSLYGFCRDRLRMSDDGAYRRKTAAQLALRFPIILKMLQSGGINLSALVMLNRYLTQENHLELLEAACGKSKRQIESVIAERFPRADIPSRMYEVQLLAGDVLPTSGATSPAVSDGQALPARNERTILQELSPGRHRIEFTGSAHLRAKLEYARDLMRHSNPKGDLGILVERAIDLLIPNVERERFGKTNRPRKTSSNDPLDQIAGGEKIPAPVRREVAERDGYQCSFESADGWRCPARSFLQFDHVIPRSRGGEHSVGNVCLKCGVHNRHAAKKVFGGEYVERKIADRQNKEDSSHQNKGLLNKEGVKGSSPVLEPRQSKTPVPEPTTKPIAQSQDDVLKKDSVEASFRAQPRQSNRSAPVPHRTTKPARPTRIGASATTPFATTSMRPKRASL